MNNHSMAASSVTFDSLPLAAPILRALKDKGYTHPSPIQERCIPILLKGRDLMGCAQTGTGKTAAFSLPILHLLSADAKPRVPKSPRALILTPTRELAVQIMDNIALYGSHLPLKHTVIFGGVNEFHQIKTMEKGVDILVATPGRLLDLMGRHHVKLDRVEIFVLDEADRMLDMGFAPDVKRVMAKLPPRRQSLLFSATMPQEIREIASRLLHNPEYVEVTPVSSTAERIEQRVCHVARENKNALLLHLLEKHPEGLVLVFTKMKHGANRLTAFLEKQGVKAAAIHGNKSQNARQRALESFRTGDTRVLVATDIAARGIDVKGITLVINYDIPNEPESYVHRIGRTARAGAEGVAYSLCEHAERSLLRDIQRLIKKTILVEREHPFAKEVQEPAQETQALSEKGEQREQRPQGMRRSGGGGNGGQGGRNRRGGGRFRFGRGRGHSGSSQQGSSRQGR